MIQRSTIFTSSFEEASSLRKELASQTGLSALGMQVLPFSAWLENAWDLWGSGAQIIAPAQRILLLSQVLKQQDSLPHSQKTVQLFARYASEVMGSQALSQAVEQCSCYQGVTAQLLEIFSQYSQELTAHKLIEPGQALTALPVSSFEGTFLRTPRFTAPYYLEEYCALHSWKLPHIGGTTLQHVLQVQPLDSSKQAEFLFPSGQSAQPALIAKRLSEWVLRAQSASLGEVGQVHYDSFNPSAQAHHIPLDQSNQVYSVMQEEAQEVKPTNEDLKPTSAKVLVGCVRPFEMLESLTPFLIEQNISASAYGAVLFTSTFFGKCFKALGTFLFSKDATARESIDALNDYMTSPYSGIALSDARMLNKRMRGFERFDFDELCLELNALSRNFSCMQELFESTDASLMLDYFFDIAEKLFKHTFDVCERECRAIETLRLWYESARGLGVSIEDLWGFVDTLQFSMGVKIGREDAPQVIIKDFSRVANAQANEYFAVLLCDLDARFFSAADTLRAFMLFDQELGISFTDTYFKQYRLLMHCAQQAASCVFACEQILVTPEDNESAYPAFFFDEYLDYYRLPDKDVPDLNTSLCRVYTMGEENLTENISPFVIDDQSVKVPLFAEGRLLSSSKDILVTRTFNHGTQTLACVSPSDIEAYVSCSYRWFIERRINPQPLDFQASALERGTFVHAVFAEFYQALKNAGYQRVNADNLVQSVELLERCFDELLTQQTDQDSAHYRMEKETDRLQAQHLKQDVVACLERQSKMFSLFVPTLFEEQINSDGSVLYAGMPLVGRVDRVDIDKEHKRFIVIDYKGSITQHQAGASADSDITPETLPKKIQTLIYAQALRRGSLKGYTCSGALYLSYNAKTDKQTLAGSYDPRVLDLQSFTTAASSVELDFHDYLDAIEEALKPYLRLMCSGAIAPSAVDGKVCKTCPVIRCERRLA